MSYQLDFDQLANYDPGQPGITLSVTLKLVSHSVNVEAKLDTGATDCVFAREQAEQLGLSVESGRPVRIRTATGSFIAHAHDVTRQCAGPRL